MRSVIQPRRILRLGLAAMMLALEVAVVAPAPGYAQTLPPVVTIPPVQTVAPLQTAPPLQPAAPVPVPPALCPGSMGPADYAVSGGPAHAAGWFYTEEACRWSPISGVGPARARGFAVVDDDNANFWTEFRRFGGIDVLGYPVSQPYHYPVGNPSGYLYQAFERGILQYHPETGRAEMANAFEQFTESDPCNPQRPDDACLDNKLMYLGIPAPQVPALSTDASYGPEQRMSWLTEPRFLARYFFDPLAFQSSDPLRVSESTFATQEQAWAFFGLAQGKAQRMVLRAPNHPSQELWPLVHSFVAQRFQKGGLQLFMEDVPPTGETFVQPMMNGDSGGQIFDPTIVPGDGLKGCVAVTAVGLLARTIGIDKVIPRAELQPTPADPNPKAFFTTFVPPTVNGQRTVDFQIDGTGYKPSERITIVFSNGQAPGTATLVGKPLTIKTEFVDANIDGSFTKIITMAPIGTYTLTITGDESARFYTVNLDLTVPTANMSVNRTTKCVSAGAPSSK